MSKSRSKQYLVAFLLPFLGLGFAFTDPEPKANIRVAYSVLGDEGEALVRYTVGERTFEKRHAVPFVFSFYARPHDQLYLAAKKSTREGELVISLDVNGQIVSEERTSAPFGQIGLDDRLLPGGSTYYTSMYSR